MTITKESLAGLMDGTRDVKTASNGDDTFELGQLAMACAAVFGRDAEHGPLTVLDVVGVRALAEEVERLSAEEKAHAECARKAAEEIAHLRDRAGAWVGKLNAAESELAMMREHAAAILSSPPAEPHHTLGNVIDLLRVEMLTTRSERDVASKLYEEQVDAHNENRDRAEKAESEVARLTVELDEVRSRAANAEWAANSDRGGE